MATRFLLDLDIRHEGDIYSSFHRDRPGTTQPAASDSMLRGLLSLASMRGWLYVAEHSHDETARAIARRMIDQPYS